MRASPAPIPKTSLPLVHLRTSSFKEKFDLAMAPLEPQPADMLLLPVLLQILAFNIAYLSCASNLTKISKVYFSVTSCEVSLS